jgi:neutral ceramidase
VRVSVTHNHANPIMWDNWIGGRPDDVKAYRASLPGAAAGAARAAKLALRPVRSAAGVGAAHIGRNRRQRVPDPTDPGRTRMIVGRDDAGTVDPAVTVVRFDELDGRPYAALLGYTCHPTTLGPDNHLHSPDYPGVAKAVMEASTGAPCLFLQGAAGNVGPMEGFTGDVGRRRAARHDPRARGGEGLRRPRDPAGRAPLRAPARVRGDAGRLGGAPGRRDARPG